MLLEKMTNDKLCRNYIDTNPNTLIPWYLMACFMLDVEKKHLIGDALFKEVCQRLIYLFPTLRHSHKELIDIKALESGEKSTMMLSDYPLQVAQQAWMKYREGLVYDV